MDQSAWAADRRLDSSIVQQILRAQFPELRPRSIALLGEGWDSEVYEVDRQWVLRFPKRAEVQVTLAREQALLPALAAQLPIAVPRFELFGQPSELFPYRFVGYRKLPGVPLQLCLTAALSSRGEGLIAQQLGEFLSALHGFEGAEHLAAMPSSDLGYLGEPIRIVEDRFAHLRAEDPVLSERLQRFMATRPASSRPDDRRVLTHADLDLEHILIDLDAERITGVIDWADVRLAAACGEFESFASWRGRAFTSQVLAHYRGPVHDADMEWIRQRAIHVALGNLTYGRMAQRPPYVQAGLHALRQVLPPAWG